jgi:membrane protein YqaA with SNARE-associated domain
MEWWPYASIFGAAFLAATLFPAQSELALVGLISAGRYNTGFLVAAASLGNVLGSLLNWIIGRFLQQYSERRWFPVPPRALARAQRFYSRWGVWTLLLSWVPIVGDPLTLVAGVLRTPLKLFLPLVTLAKVGRYCAIAGLSQLF